MRWSFAMLLSSIFTLSFIQLSVSKPTIDRRWGDMVEKHSWVEAPKGWELHATPPQDYVMNMRIALTQGKIDDLIKSLYEVSTPSHSRYGQHLSKEQVNALVAPHPDSVEAVQSWLNHHGIDPLSSERSEAGDWFRVNVTVDQANRMLDTQYSLYRHTGTNETIVRALKYSIPSTLLPHVQLITPTTYFGTTNSMRVTSFEQSTLAKPTDPIAVRPIPDAVPPSSCGSTITPSCLRILYNTINYVPKATDRNSLGVAGYLNQFANHADLATFLRVFRNDQIGQDFTTIRINGGGDNQGQPGFDANLNIQYTIGISGPTPNVYYSTGGSPPFQPDSQTPTNTNEPYLDWLVGVLAESTIPQTVTTSYGDDEQTVPADYAQVVCNMFAQLGARGSSVLFSSGDFGVGGGDCRTNDGTNRVLFKPIFPASCPFVTAVGATTGINPEVAASFSGGGFSRLFPAPSYQQAAVSRYLATLGTRNQGLFNRTGRAYPDVAAQGVNFQIVLGGVIGSLNGTTAASSPTVAGVIALLNDARLASGQPSLGFLNPLLYSNPSAFNDIVSGANPGCGTAGFSATVGWDPVTGLGTPDFMKLLAVVI